MIGFSALIDGLAFARTEATQTRILAQYLATTADPARGLALALLSGALAVHAVKPALVRALAAERVDPVLLGMSQDFVGDGLEAIGLLWPAAKTNAAAPSLAEIIAALAETPRADLPARVAAWMNAADASARVVLLKLITGGRALLCPPAIIAAALVALSRNRAAPHDIVAVWHTQAPPFAPLLAWIEGRGPRPAATGAPYFRPALRPQTIAARAAIPLTTADLVAEWRWDGLRVQLAAGPGGARLFSATGVDISAAFPDILATMRFHAVLDGVLLAEMDGAVRPFAAPHPRLERKPPTARQIAAHRMTVKLFDLLDDAGEDLRCHAFDARRIRLEAWFARVCPDGMALSECLPNTLWDNPPALPPAVTGLVFKSRQATYGPEPASPRCWEVKRAATSRLAVLMYAHRNARSISGPYASYTVGLWLDDGTLVPVGKADAAMLDPSLRAALDLWIDTHTVERFGPVRAVEVGLTLKVGFDAVRRSARHKSGIVLESLTILAVLPEYIPKSAAGIGSLIGLL